MIEEYQQRFIEFAIATGVLQFGEFELKSGRVSPYFFNSGLFDGGKALSLLGEFYSEALINTDIEFDMLFGPAYKGIPLVSTTSIALYARHGRDVPYAFNRKEIKGHGEGGQLVGAELKGKVVIVDDVITAGTAIREVMELLKDSPVEVTGVLVAIDRQERGKGNLSAIQEVKKEYGISVASVVRLNDLVDYLETTDQYDIEVELVRRYRKKYGTD
jgi:orotate phosphoribosyltransferase